MISNLPDVVWPVAVFLLTLLWDLVLGEPALHPVAAIGKTIDFLAQKAPRHGSTWPFLYGLGMALLIPAVFALAAYGAAQGALRLHPAVYILVSAFLLKSCFSVRGLDRAATSVAQSLSRHVGTISPGLEEARGKLKSMVSRDTAGLTPALAASAAVESVAENTTDSFLGPWLAFALFGLPGAFAYRAINTLDSMIGYHGSYEYLGKASARLDDLVNLVPARLAALFIVAAGYLVGLGHSTARACRTMWRQHSLTSSPNAGWTMSAMAGLLGTKLHKAGHYHLGEGAEPGTSDIIKAVRVMYGVAAVAAALTVAVIILRQWTL